jgi:hypothetical protein
MLLANVTKLAMLTNACFRLSSQELPMKLSHIVCHFWQIFTFLSFGQYLPQSA